MPIIQDIFTYAFRGSGKYILVLGAVMSVIADLASNAPLLGLLAGLFLAGYFCAIYFQIIQTTATGSGEAPAFPEATNILSDLIWPMFQVIIVFLVSVGPAIVYPMVVGVEGFNPGVFFGLLGFAVVYFPMAMLAVVVLGYMGALSPHIVLPAIFRGGGLYWLGVFVLILLYMAKGFVAGMLEGQPIVASLVMALVGMYIMMTNGRILGIIYREREEELNWI